jgi:pimeloyl-ACP methyl ester carboxylesterase
MTVIQQKLRNCIHASLRVGVMIIALSFCLYAQGKNPLILIPGLAGSELRHKTTDEKIWFKTFKSKSEDLKLPLFADPTKTHDDLVATDALRNVKIAGLPVYDVYGDFINGMVQRGGYHEEKWDAPSADGFKDSLYIFAYDWRLDNVENARLLVRKIEELKLKLKKPDLRFDVVAHSMGGIISRYAAMYGDTDLPAHGLPRLSWAGARFFNKIVLLGTPNEGSVNALGALVTGYALGSVRMDLPFVQNSSKFVVFTIPAAYELLPAPGTLRAFDEKLNPVAIDIYDPRVWAKYGWKLTSDPKFSSHFNSAERKVAESFFAAVLDRSKRLHEALEAAHGQTGGIDFFVIGSDCKTAEDAIVVYRAGKANEWKTLFRPKDLKRQDGSKVTADELKKLMLAPGDGIVTSRSLQAHTESEKASVPSIIGSKEETMFCEGHSTLAASDKIQDHIIGLLTGKPVPEKKEQEKK